MARGNPHEHIACANIDKNDPLVIPSSGRPHLPYCVRQALDTVPPAEGRLPRQWAKALKNYTLSSKKLNQYVVQEIRGQEDDSHLDAWSVQLCKAIRFISWNKFGGPGQLWRGCNLYYRQLQWYERRVGKVIQWNSFTSCSRSPRVAENFLTNDYGDWNPRKVEVLFEIRRDPAWITGADISKYAADEFAWEKETLLIPGCRFHVLRVEQFERRAGPDRFHVLLRERMLKSHNGGVTDTYSHSGWTSCATSRASSSDSSRTSSSTCRSSSSTSS